MTTKRKKLNSDILSIRSDDGAGASVQGILGETHFMKRDDGTSVVGKFGQELWTFDLADKKTGEIKKYWGDGGLKGSFKMCNLKPGMYIEIVHTGTKKIEDGTVQTYDVFELE